LNAQLRLLDIPAYRVAASPSLVPFLKWPGGKSQELQAISTAAPELAGRFIDPFVGGGSVLLAVPEEVEAWANDAAQDLLELYRAAAEERPAFRNAVIGVAHGWDALRFLRPIYQTLAVEFLDGPSGRGAVSAASGTGAFSRALAMAGPGSPGPDAPPERICAHQTGAIPRDRTPSSPIAPRQPRPRPSETVLPQVDADPRARSWQRASCIGTNVGHR
jgi:hypothetical protein